MMTRTPLIRLVFRNIAPVIGPVFAFSALLGAGQAVACAFHYYLPEKTAVDYLVDGSDVVLARTAPDNKFAYKTAIVLRGTGPDAPLPFLVDRVTRLKMANNPDDYRLFARENGDAWQSVSHVTPAYHKLLEQVLTKSNTWEAGYSAERLALFAPLLTHPDPLVQKLALREVDKAPYALLRQADTNIPADRLLSQLWTREGVAFQSIRVLLLGLSDTAQARAEVYDFFDRTQSWQSANNLGAFATALIELDGIDGVARLEDRLLSDPAQPLAKLEQALEAMAIQNAGAAPDVRRAITNALIGLIERNPQIAPVILRPFEARNDLSQGEVLARVIRNPAITDRADQLAIMRYVTRSERAAALAQ